MLLLLILIHARSDDAHGSVAKWYLRCQRHQFKNASNSQRDNERQRNNSAVVSVDRQSLQRTLGEYIRYIPYPHDARCYSSGDSTGKLPQRQQQRQSKPCPRSRSGCRDTWSSRLHLSVYSYHWSAFSIFMFPLVSMFIPLGIKRTSLRHAPTYSNVDERQ